MKGSWTPDQNFNLGTPNSEAESYRISQICGLRGCDIGGCVEFYVLGYNAV
jgi:hypothetical protein